MGQRPVLWETCVGVRKRIKTTASSKTRALQGRLADRRNERCGISLIQGVLSVMCDAGTCKYHLAGILLIECFFLEGGGGGSG